MSEYALPETITVLNQTLTYEERGFYYSGSTSVLDIRVWVPLPGLWMILVSNNGVSVFETRGGTLLEAEKALVKSIKQYKTETETFLGILMDALQQENEKD